MQNDHRSPPVWIGPKQAAALLGTSTDYVYAHHTDVGWPRSIRVGLKIKWLEHEFKAWIETRFDRQPVDERKRA